MVFTKGHRVRAKETEQKIKDAQDDIIEDLTPPSVKQKEFSASVPLSEYYEIIQDAGHGHRGLGPISNEMVIRLLAKETATMGQTAKDNYKKDFYAKITEVKKKGFIAVKGLPDKYFDNDRNFIKPTTQEGWEEYHQEQDRYELDQMLANDIMLKINSCRTWWHFKGPGDSKTTDDRWLAMRWRKHQRKVEDTLSEDNRKIKKLHPKEKVWKFRIICKKRKF